MSSDAALERAVPDLLAQRAAGATICPSDGEVEITQAGTVVDPSTAKGPIRVRRR